MKVLISLSNTVAGSNGIDLSGHHLSLGLDEGTGDTVINFVDNITGEVIRHIPPAHILKLRKATRGLQEILIDKET